MKKENQVSSEQQGFRDPTGLTKWTKWFLYAQVVIAVVSAISGLLEYQLLSDFNNRVYSSQDQAVAAEEANAARQSIVAVVYMIIFFVSGILILKWIHRANYNARQLGADDMVFTPGWSIGWYFMPIANLWKPYQAMREIWKASSNPESWSTESVSSMLPWWWFFFILSSILGNASLRLTMRAEKIDALFEANVVTLFSDLAGIPLSLIVLWIISKIYEMQMSHAKVQKNI